MARGGSDDLVRLVVVGGLLYGGYTFARKPGAPLGETAKKWADYIHDNLLSPGGSGGLPPAGGTTDPEVAAWARAINLSYEVGRRFKADNGRLPNSIAELEQWGASKNYRRADGSWTI